MSQIAEAQSSAPLGHAETMSAPLGHGETVKEVEDEMVTDTAEEFVRRRISIPAELHYEMHKFLTLGDSIDILVNTPSKIIEKAVRERNRRLQNQVKTRSIYLKCFFFNFRLECGIRGIVVLNWSFLKTGYKFNYSMHMVN